MKAGDYPHPEDEFDVATSRSGPRGVHRAPRSTWARWRPFVVVLVLFPLLAFGLVTWLSSWDGLSGIDLPTFTDTADEPDEGDGTEEPADEPTDPATDETTEPPVETPEPPPAVADMSRPVEVLNSTSTSGLAANGSDKVEAAGFTTVTAGNWQGDDVAASVVYYPGPDDVATAQAVAAALGITAVEESATVAADGIVAVLAADYVR